MQNGVREFRGKNNLSQEKLSKSLGITRPVLSNIENNKVMSKALTMMKIANYFNVIIEEMFLE